MNNYIPYDLRSKLIQIDPVLDVHWHTRLSSIFKNVPKNIHGAIQNQFLNDKKVTWNAELETFTFQGFPNLEELTLTFKSPKIQTLAHKIIESYASLKSYQDVFKIADYLESVQSQIDLIEAEDDQTFLIEKQVLRKTFLYDSANIIKTLSFQVPDNCRHLTVDEIRTYILEVYLKHQILGYWFKTILPRQLKQIKDSLFQDFILPEQKIRDFDVVESGAYLFLIAASHNLRQNSFSIRRFLIEERYGVKEQIYLNGVVLDKKRFSDAEYIEQFKWQVSRMITIQRQISTPVYDLMEQLHNVNFDVLLPLLKKPLEATGYSVEQVIRERLLDYENALTIQVLHPLHHALLNTIQHQDEFDYCFSSVHRLFSDIISFYKDFSSEPIIAFNTQAKIFEFRIIAYLKLLEKRQLSIFTPLDAEAYKANNEKSLAPFQQVKGIISEALEQHKAQQLALTQKKRELENQSEKTFLNKVFDKSEKLQTEIEELKTAQHETHRQAYLELIKVPKKYAESTVYLEFECLISINHTERHYAFITGDNGVSALPVLVQLPENRDNLNLQHIHNTLIFDLSQSRQKW